MTGPIHAQRDGKANTRRRKEVLPVVWIPPTPPHTQKGGSHTHSIQRPFYLWSNKGDVDGETIKNSLRSLRREAIKMEILTMSDAAHAWLRVNSTVTEETWGPEAIFNARTGAHHDTLYEALKYLLSSAYVPRTILRSNKFYRRKGRVESSRSQFLICQ